MKNHSGLLSLLFIGLMTPPAIWLLILYYSQAFTLDELLSIVISAPMISYIIFITSGVLYLFNKKISHITKAIETGINSVDSYKAISILPIWFMVTQLLYSTFGPTVVLSGVDFVTTQKFWLSQLVVLPIILLFTIPIFISFVISLEKMTKNIDLSEKYKFISFGQKMFSAIFTTWHL